MTDKDSREKIKSLNDRLCQTMCSGRVMITQGIIAPDAAQFARLIPLIMNFNDFTEDNDPYGEHDFSSLILDGHCIF